MVYYKVYAYPTWDMVTPYRFIRGVLQDVLTTRPTSWVIRAVVY